MGWASYQVPDKNFDDAVITTQQALKKCPQNYKPWIWTLVVMATITAAWAVYEGFQQGGNFLGVFSQGDDSSRHESNSNNFAIQSATAPEQVKGLQTSYHSIIDSVRPAVITIDALGDTPETGVSPPAAQADIPVAAFNRIGSGVIIDPRGYVLSSYHIVAGADMLKATVYSPGGALQYPLKLVKADKGSDLALLRIQAGGLFPSAPLGDSDTASTGDMVLTLGNPFGFDQTVTAGIISNRNRTLTLEGTVYENLIQTDASINKGSSGGPLVSVKGEVIGINTAIFSPTGVFNGIGFAIPINRASELVGGVVDFNNSQPDVATGQLAAWARCGRQVGNTFRQPDGQIITPPHPYRGVCVDCHPQLFSRLGQGNGQGMGQGQGNGRRGIGNVAPAKQVGLNNGTGPGCLPVAGTTAAVEPYLGIELLEVNEIVARQFNLVHPEGVLVNSVRNEGPAGISGLQRGDIIIRAAGRKILNINSFNRILAGRNIGSTFDLVVLRKGSRQTISLKTGVRPPSAELVVPLRQKAEFEWLGAEMTPLSPALAPYQNNGVFVSETGGILSLSGLKAGDIIVGLNGKQVTDMNTFIQLTKTADTKKGFMLDIVRSGIPLYLAIKG